MKNDPAAGNGGANHEGYSSMSNNLSRSRTKINPPLAGPLLAARRGLAEALAALERARQLADVAGADRHLKAGLRLAAGDVDAAARRVDRLVGWARGGRG